MKNCKYMEKDPYSIKMASTEEVDQVRGGVNRVLLLIAPYILARSKSNKEIQEWVDTVFVSDESTIGDFGLEDQQVEEIAQKLGFPVSHQSYIKNVAMTI